MPPPIGPYDRANPPGSSGLTQSHDAARQQANKAQGYDPDALQRVLDWIGRQVGSDRAARRPGPSAGSRVVDWIGRQFESDPYAIGASKNPRVTDPYDRKNPAVDAWFRSLENSPTPFGNVQYGPNKPVTKISSAPKIAQKLVETMAPQYNADQNLGNTEPWMPFQPQGPDDRSQWAGAGQQPWDFPEFGPGGEPYKPPMVDFSAGPMPPDVNFGGLPPRDPTWFERVNTGKINPELLKSLVYPPPPKPVRTSQSPFSTAGPSGRAEGGPVGLMRGGYPELFGATKMPVRHTFDSGGENFVGNEYGGTGGRSDDVNARLSPKEYVMDSESMSLLGDGNPDHGAKKMDEMRANLRRHKGQALAKGKFSPKAKSAQEYLVGNPMGDGLRRRGRDKV